MFGNLMCEISGTALWSLTSESVSSASVEFRISAVSKLLVCLSLLFFLVLGLDEQEKTLLNSP